MCLRLLSVIEAARVASKLSHYPHRFQYLSTALGAPASFVSLLDELYALALFMCLGVFNAMPYIYKTISTDVQLIR